MDDKKNEELMVAGQDDLIVEDLEERLTQGSWDCGCSSTSSTCDCCCSTCCWYTIG